MPPISSSDSGRPSLADEERKKNKKNVNPTLNSTSFEQELHFFFPFAVFELLVGSIHERLQDIVRFLLGASSLPDHVVEDILDLPVSFVPLPNDDKTSQIILQSVLAP